MQWLLVGVAVFAMGIATMDDISADPKMRWPNFVFRCIVYLSGLGLLVLTAWAHWSQGWF